MCVVLCCVVYGVYVCMFGVYFLWFNFVFV